MPIQPVRLTLQLPPDALLPKCREVLIAIARVLDRALEPAKRFRRVRDDRDNDVRLACAVHALNALDASHAAYAVSGTDYPAGTALHLRVIFEALLKIRWMRKDPLRAKAYLDSEPFERYAHAEGVAGASHRWSEIVEACEAAVKADPSLLSLPKVLNPNKSPNFKRIAAKLRMPKILVMATDVGMQDEYFIDFDVPSFYPHTSVLHTKSFAQRLNADGTVELSTKVNAIALSGFVVRAATRAGAITSEVLELWPDGAVQFAAENALEELVQVVNVLKGFMDGAQQT